MLELPDLENEMSSVELTADARLILVCDSSHAHRLATATISVNPSSRCYHGSGTRACRSVTILVKAAQAVSVMILMICSSILECEG
jgi:hypothetical protein